MAVLVHGVLVVGPIVSTSLAVARFLAAERALIILKDPESEKCLTKICTCGQEMAIDDILAVDSLTAGEEDMLFADHLDSSDLDEVNLSILSEPSKD
jgi:endoribonuclease Dicer